MCNYKGKQKMKKLMVTMMAIALAAIANAATVKGSVTNVQVSPNTAVAAGWAVQIFDQSVAYDYAKAVAGDITAWTTGSTVASGTSFRANGTATQADGSTESYYMVIYDNASIADAKNYIVSSLKSVTTNAAGSDVNASFGSMSGTGSTNMFLSSSWTATSAVPEPTSGLLLLLGMAGLALKRKRA
jgi:hypothetical protein